MRFLRVAVCLSLIAGPALALTQSPAPPLAAPATLDQVGWIAGQWIDDSGGNLSEEVWAAPAGNSMLGMWRYVAKGKVQILELLSITAEDGGPVFRLRHFDPRMVAREEKDKPLALKLIFVKDREAAFEGPGQPTGTVRLTYRRPADDSLSVTLDKDGGSQTFQFRRRSP
jgi:hypothetical protein